MALDQKKMDDLVIKMRTHDDPLSCIYQWVLTRHIKYDEFQFLIGHFMGKLAKRAMRPVDPTAVLQDSLPIE